MMMKRLYFFVAVLMAMLNSCTNIENATVDDIKKACSKEDWSTAKKMCEAYVKKDKNNPFVYKYLGDAYLGMKDSTFAQYSYEQAIILDSTYVDAIVGSVDVLMNSGSAPLAISQLQAFITNIPDNAKLYNALGCAFRVCKNNNEARANFEKAVSLDQSYVSARRNLAVMQINGHEYEDAILNLETILDENPDFPEIYDYLGVAYAFKGDNENAEKMFLKAISVDDKFLPAIEDVAFFYDQLKNLEKAKKYYEMAANLGSKNSQEILKRKKFNK